MQVRYVFIQHVRVVCGCLDMSAALKRSGTAGMYIWHYISILKYLNLIFGVQLPSWES